VHGDRDEFFPVNIPVEMYQAIPTAALWIVPEGGHVPIHDPAVPFLRRALQFLANSEARVP
jgi:pimeloyl-ACP methyl ester carboxylesterase